LGLTSQIVINTREYDYDSVAGVDGFTHQADEVTGLA
jgi:hypothetical protein